MNEQKSHRVKVLLNIAIILLSGILLLTLLWMVGRLHDSFTPYPYLSGSAQYLIDEEAYGRLATYYYLDHADFVPTEDENYAVGEYAADSFFVKLFTENGNEALAESYRSRRSDAYEKMGSLQSEAGKIEEKLSAW